MLAARTATRFEYAMQLNVEGVRQSLYHMPASTYKTYCMWVLNTPSLSGQWLQLMGVESLIRLTGGLLDDMFDHETWLKLVPYSVPINVSQMYEVISDNLAIGLGHRSPDDRTFTTRRQLVYTFNQSVIQRLRGDSHRSARASLDPFVPLMSKISAFDQSLSAEKHRSLARQFLKANPSAAIRDLEYALHPLLIANMETGIDLTNVLEDTVSHSLLVKGLIQRYQGVVDLFERQNLSQHDLLTISTNTIMVIPTLAYYASIIAEKVHPIPAYRKVIEDGSLLEVLEDAALLVRLLNDMGTLLLEQTPDDRTTFISWLRGLNQKLPFPTFEHLMLEATGHHDTLLTRMRKDVKFGEFNVCLYPVRQAASVADALDIFTERIDNISAVYRQRLQRLHKGTQTLNQRLGSNLVGDLAMRFVQFHRHTYSQSFESPQGEYAV